MPDKFAENIFDAKVHSTKNVQSRPALAAKRLNQKSLVCEK